MPAQKKTGCRFDKFQVLNTETEASIRLKSKNPELREDIIGLELKYGSKIRN
ncbi:hypothetical protein [Methanosarcina mazei]|uniref:hypothetical protein n=1 Tax=Methanosarcina mazei TaxID=2209 RepID=UPI000A86F558|nr:hypothetical protein [Methanosarcina mazei]